MGAPRTILHLSSEDLESEALPSSESGVLPVATVRPTFDVAAFARDSEDRMAVASLVPTRPAPPAPSEKVRVPAPGKVSDELRDLLALTDPF